MKDPFWLLYDWIMKICDTCDKRQIKQKYTSDDWLNKDERAEVRKWYKRYAKDFANQHGFLLYKKNHIVKEIPNTDLVFHICFDFHESSLYVHTAFQPLLLLSDDLHFTCGSLITEYPPSLPVSLFMFRQRTDEDKQIVTGRLENNVMPMVNAISSPTDFIKLLEDKESPIRCNPYLKKAYIVFSYLKAEQYAKAKDRVNEFLDFLEEENHPMAIEHWFPIITPIADALNTENYSEIQLLLKSNSDIMRERFCLTNSSLSSR